MRILKRSLLPFIIIITLGGCATIDIAALTADDHQYGQTPDEQKLIDRAVRFNEDLTRKGLILQNGEVQRYIDRVGENLVPPKAADAVEFDFYVFRDPIVNAFALPDGSIYITVGLLTRMENEAQLAHVLSHEVAHVILRHGLKQHRSHRAGMISSHIADLVLFGTSIAYIPYITSMASYSREQEEEADRMALDLMSSAGYNLASAYQLFAIIQEIKDTESVKGSIWGSHPSNAQRAEYTKRIVDSGAVAGNPEGRIGRGEYQHIKSELIIENIKLKLRVKQYELALDSIDAALKESPASPWLYYYRGEAYRRLGDDPKGAAREHAWIYGKKYGDDLVHEFENRHKEFYTAARKSYEKALSVDTDFAHGYRGLGLLSYQRGDYKVAREALEFYLSHGRDIRDKRYINNILNRIDKL